MPLSAIDVNILNTENDFSKAVKYIIKSMINRVNLTRYGILRLLKNTIYISKYFRL